MREEDSYKEGEFSYVKQYWDAVNGMGKKFQEWPAGTWSSDDLTALVAKDTTAHAASTGVATHTTTAGGAGGAAAIPADCSEELQCDWIDCFDYEIISGQECWREMCKSECGDELCTLWHWPDATTGWVEDTCKEPPAELLSVEWDKIDW